MDDQLDMPAPAAPAAAPPRSPCSAPNCDFLPPDGANFVEQLALLKYHERVAHPKPIPAATHLELTAPKQPTLTEDVSDAGWNLFYTNWARFKRTYLRNFTDADLSDLLHYSCSDKLVKAIHNIGLPKPCSEADMLDAMKKMAVKKQNALVKTLRFYRMHQLEDETTNAYFARLKGQASTCDFKLPTGNSDFTDWMLNLQLVHGIKDHDIQERMLAEAALHDEPLTLDATFRFIQALEAGKQDAKQMQELSAGICGISPSTRRTRPRRQEDATRPRRLAHPEPTPDKVASPPPSYCRWCGERHGRGYEQRQTQCKAFHETCARCNKTGHFQAVCRGRSRNTSSSSSSESDRSTGTSRRPNGRRRTNKRYQSLPPAYQSLGVMGIATTSPDKPPKKCRPEDDTCNCAQRTETPEPPKLRYAPTEENADKIKQQIIEHYASSCFNQCEKQPLPLMTDAPALRLHIDPNAKPVACHNPRPVPIQWQEKVRSGLDRDVRIGVLEKVPVGTPARWCAPMVLVPKHDGDPRRTVDYTVINRHSVRQTHPTTAPYLQATSIPANTYKTVLDAWHGYHSVPIEASDVHYTTFITPWGRYRHLTAPQGFIAAGDGYTNRFDEITVGLKNQTRCIDDTAIWDDDIRSCYNKTCEFLTRCGKAGIVFNKDKFQFAQQEIDFLGFRVTNEEVKPGKKFIEAVSDFPRPTNITGVRSWFGLINQLAYTLSTTTIMEPFKKLLKATTEFAWTEETEEAFIKSKESIIEAIKKGVKIYDPTRPTALLTDWSKIGMGHVLMQKTCECSGRTPLCCPTGWQVTAVGSRFNHSAETRYHPVEGEMLAVAWALDNTKYFTRGHPDLTVVVDHRPLLKLLGDRKMADIENPRLHNLKEKTLGFKFNVVYIPGKEHLAADSTSRQPTGPPVSLLAIGERTTTHAAKTRLQALDRNNATIAHISNTLAANTPDFIKRLLGRRA